MVASQENLDIKEVDECRSKVPVVEWTELKKSAAANNSVKDLVILLFEMVLFTLEFSLENGKLFEAYHAGDTPSSVMTLCYYGGHTDKIFGLTLQVNRQYEEYTLLEPIGIVEPKIIWMVIIHFMEPLKWQRQFE
ncbi:hypothetical protein SUGI_0308480 [Cryptomeria japonica]|nr:hypothetical protein SUGI_0308480 [Cryptomeria japonica]